MILQNGDKENKIDKEKSGVSICDDFQTFFYVERGENVIFIEDINLKSF